MSLVIVNLIIILLLRLADRQQQSSESIALWSRKRSQFTLKEESEAFTLIMYNFLEQERVFSSAGIITLKNKVADECWRSLQHRPTGFT